MLFILVGLVSQLQKVVPNCVGNNSENIYTVQSRVVRLKAVITLRTIISASLFIKNKIRFIYIIFTVQFDFVT